MCAYVCACVCLFAVCMCAYGKVWMYVSVRARARACVSKRGKEKRTKICETSREGEEDDELKEEKGNCYLKRLLSLFVQIS